MLFSISVEKIISRLLQISKISEITRFNGNVNKKKIIIIAAPSKTNYSKHTRLPEGVRGRHLWCQLAIRHDD